MSKHVAVLMGGWSAEREISLRSGKACADAAERVGYRVSRVDHYVLCPFKYFAENVLGLPEERDDLAGLTPLERGNLDEALQDYAALPPA